MEDTLVKFLNGIVSEIHAPQEIGPNRFVIEMKGWADLNGTYIYIGNKRNMYCEQQGREIHIGYGKWAAGPHFIVDLADPTSREKIVNIFRTN